MPVWYGRHEIEPGGIIRDSALRSLRVHPLPAADALPGRGRIKARRFSDDGL